MGTQFDFFADDVDLSTIDPKKLPFKNQFLNENLLLRIQLRQCQAEVERLKEVLNKFQNGDYKKAVDDLSEQWSALATRNKNLLLYIGKLNWTAHRLKDIIVQVGDVDIKKIHVGGKIPLEDEEDFFTAFENVTDQLKPNLQAATDSLGIVAAQREAIPIMKDADYDPSGDPMFRSSNPSKKRTFYSTNANEHTKTTTSQPAKNVSYYY